MVKNFDLGEKLRLTSQNCSPRLKSMLSGESSLQSLSGNLSGTGNLVRYDCLFQRQGADRIFLGLFVHPHHLGIDIFPNEITLGEGSFCQLDLDYRLNINAYSYSQFLSGIPEQGISVTGTKIGTRNRKRSRLINPSLAFVPYDSNENILITGTPIILDGSITELDF